MKPKTLLETLDNGNPRVYPGIYVAVTILLTYQFALLHDIATFCSVKP